MAGWVERLVAEAGKEFRRQVGRDPDRIEVTADLRYPGQSHETNVAHRPGEAWADLSDRFHEAHQRLNGFAHRDQPVELVTLRVTALSDPALSWEDLPPGSPEGQARLADRRLPDGTIAARWQRAGLAPSQEVLGPAVIEEAQATTWLGAGERALVLEDGTLEVSW
jgi:N-methylhydantoinase A